MEYCDIPYNEMSSRAIPWHTTFIGQVMQHNYWMYAIVDRVMLANPQIESIVEIGTGSGALSMVFGLWGVKRGIRVLTIDHEVRHDPQLLRWVDVEFLQADEMSEAAQESIASVVGGRPTWLFCDGGCKRDEFRFYGPVMPVGSIVSAHDLGMEFRHEIDAFDVPGMEKYEESWWTEANVQLALYKRV